MAFLANVARQYSTSGITSEPALLNALLNPDVKAEFERLVTRVTGFPIGAIEANLTPEGTRTVFDWMVHINSKINTGESNAPKGQP